VAGPAGPPDAALTRRPSLAPAGRLSGPAVRLQLTSSKEAPPWTNNLPVSNLNPTWGNTRPAGTVTVAAAGW
jgi:hypothetical protein